MATFEQWLTQAEEAEAADEAKADAQKAVSSQMDLETPKASNNYWSDIHHSGIKKKSLSLENRQLVAFTMVNNHVVPKPHSDSIKAQIQLDDAFIVPSALSKSLPDCEFIKLKYDVVLELEPKSCVISILVKSGCNQIELCRYYVKSDTLLTFE